MKAQKYTIKVEIHALSVQVIGGLLNEVVTEVQKENHNGQLEKDDGDMVRWSIESKPVSF